MHLGKPGGHVEELTQGFRVPADVIAYAARLLPVAAPGLAPPASVRRTSGDLVVARSPRPLDAGAAAVTAALTREGSVAMVVPDAAVRRAVVALRAAGVAHAVLGEEDDIVSRVDLVPATLAKGLEFDHVVLVEPAAIAAAEADAEIGLRRLYVCLTRAVTSLTVLHAQPLPHLLAA